MATLLALDHAKAASWLEKLGAPLAGAVVEALDFCVEEQSLHLQLLMQAVPEDALCFQALRQELEAAGENPPLLKVRYGGGMLTAGEYLALHFEDLAGRLRGEWNGSGHLVGRLEYEEAEAGRLRLLVESQMHVERLKTKKAQASLAEWLQWGCGEAVDVELAVGEWPAEEPAPAQAPVVESRAAAPAGHAPPLQQSALKSAAAPAQAAPQAPKAEGPELLFGRAVPQGKAVPLSELKAGDRCIVEGRVFGENQHRIIGEKKRLKIGFRISDATDSVLCALWLDGDAKVPKPLAKKASGDWLRLRGKVEADQYERGELVLSADDVARIPAPAGRGDDAAVKRVELHAHTKMSSNDSVVDVGSFVRRAIQWGHPAVAVTDHGVVHAFPDAAKAAGDKIKLLLGCEAYFVEDTGFLKERSGSAKLDKDKVPPFHHIILLCRNEQGRKNMYKLVSRSHLESYYRKPLISRALLTELREGIVVGSACENGELMQALIRGEWDTARKLAEFYDYLEVQPPANNAFMVKNGTFKDEEPLKELVRSVVRLGKELGKPVVATGDVHYLNPEDEVYRRIMQTGIGMSDAEDQAPLYFKTTGEMLADLSFLGAEEAHRVVVDAPRAVAESIDKVRPVPKGRFFPKMAGDAQQVREAAEARAKAIYGEPLPAIVHERLESELGAIIGNGFASLYLMARLLVMESEKRGYSVGSRGSVGSSVAAYLLGITEVNPLPAHERCPSCRFCEFRPMERLSGIDLPARPCPRCSQPLLRDGHNIPFATFVGIKGDKVPDIDLNFAPEVQGEIQKYVKILFGEGKVFKAGTVSTYSDKTAYGFVKKYLEAKGLVKRAAEVDRIAEGLEGVKRTSGQHPGGVVLVQEGCEITDFTPVQYPGDSKELGGKEGNSGDDLVITHFDFHSYDETLVKLDILGKDDASAFKHLEEITGFKEREVPLDDPQALSLFRSRKELGFPRLSEEEEALFGPTGAVALPEFGTENTRRMLKATQPKNFTELIYISGLSHGTGVWAGNSENLINSKAATLETVISTRDDIMNTLIQKGMDASVAFAITEKVRKGKAAVDGFSPEEEAALKVMPKWWVESCKKIEYMFPKAHAAAYCFTAVRMAWFKVHHPRAFYAAWLTLHAGDLEAGELSKGREAVLARLRQLRLAEQEGKATPKEAASVGALVVAFEAILRGLRFERVDLYKSHPFRFQPGAEEGSLLPPLVSMPGLGESAALGVERERKLAPFKSVEDLGARAGLNKTVIEKLSATGALDILPKTNQITLF